MDQVAIMRRTDGALFVLTRQEKMHLALWPSLQSAMRYKMCNAELLEFSPVPASGAFARKSLAPLRGKGWSLFLLIDEGDARLNEGRTISWEELEDLLPVASLASTPASTLQPIIHSSTQPLPVVEEPSTSGSIRTATTDPLPSLNQFNDDGGNPNLVKKRDSG